MDFLSFTHGCGGRSLHKLLQDDPLFKRFSRVALEFYIIFPSNKCCWAVQAPACLPISFEIRAEAHPNRLTGDFTQFLVQVARLWLAFAFVAAGAFYAILICRSLVKGWMFGMKEHWDTGLICPYVSSLFGKLPLE